MIDDNLNLHSNYGLHPSSAITPPTGLTWTYICNNNSTKQCRRNMIPLSSSSLGHDKFNRYPDIHFCHFDFFLNFFILHILIQLPWNLDHINMRPTWTKSLSWIFDNWDCSSIVCKGIWRQIHQTGSEAVSQQCFLHTDTNVFNDMACC